MVGFCHGGNLPSGHDDDDDDDEVKVQPKKGVFNLICQTAK